ncbi:hypothetical protein ACPPVT_03625 [Angustibacter sp. McL0619]|uniref:hypothetical protein n=1 Tax=Angustibacter sp. McL0619 TaxID=3415676 RepID=UPI003CE7BFF3
MNEYVISVAGPLPDDLLRAFPGLSRRQVPVHTMLSGELADQCALQGVLNQLEVSGAEILEVRRLPPSGQPRGDDGGRGA